MKLDYEYIKFELLENKPKTQVYGCYNKNSSVLLARIAWYGPWRQYCFFPIVQTVYSKGCMKDIISFIEELSK